MKFLGNTDEVTVCDCCGRQDLKGTVAIEKEDESVVYYGVVCAAKALSLTSKAVRQAAKKADDDKADAARAEHNKIQAAKHASWTRFLSSKSPVYDWDGKLSVFRSVQALGGFTKAQEMYDSEGGESKW